MFFYIHQSSLIYTCFDCTFVAKQSKKNMRVAIRHSVKISSSHRLIVEPPIANARMRLGQNLQSLISMIVDQPRPTSDTVAEDGKRATFRSILVNMNVNKIIACYAKIEDICRRADIFADSWLTYQALWDMNITVVFNNLGSDIAQWICLLNDMKASQSKTLSVVSAGTGSESVEKSFGPLIVHFGGVCNKVELKYHEFRKQTFEELCSRLSDFLRDFMFELQMVNNSWKIYRYLF